nr:MurR/RpiR family transcriptional regulator [Citricoccus sp. CH26A]
MSPPQSYPELRAVLQERMPAMSKGQQRIATVLLSDPEGTAFRTIAKTAEAAEVHQSSLVRFATALGLKGYPALVHLCRAHLSDQAHLVRRFEQATTDSSSEGLMNAVLEHEKQNLSRTFARIQPEQWDQAVELLASAPAVHVIGLRKCLPVAQLFSYLLHLVRPDVHLLAPAAGMLVDEIRDMKAGDVFVGISLRRYTADTVRTFRAAKQRGLHTIALTDNPSSPLSDADVTFYVDSQGVHILRSISAFISLVQTLATAVAFAKGADSRSKLNVDEELLQSMNIYWEEKGHG